MSQLLIVDDSPTVREQVSTAMRGQGHQVTVAEDQLRPVIDSFVTQIWKHMERWGIAVDGGYWKPILKVQVAPGAEARFDELQALMTDSGIELERKTR